MWEEVLEAMWAATFEFRKGCDLYRGLIGCLTALLFHRDALACSDCHVCIIKVRRHFVELDGLLFNKCGICLEINSSENLIIIISVLALRNYMQDVSFISVSTRMFRFFDMLNAGVTGAAEGW